MDTTAAARRLGSALLILIVLSISTNSFAQCLFPDPTPIYNQTFGAGPRPAVSPLTTEQVPELEYRGTGNMNPEKIYTLTSTSSLHEPANDWYTVTDHTGNANGLMMLVNDREPAGITYRDKISSSLLGQGNLHFFSAWVMNILVPGRCTMPGNDPDIYVSLRVEVKAAGAWSVLASSSVFHFGSPTASPDWRKIGISFTTPTSPYDSIRINVNNESTVVCGNDYVLDDIVVTRCASNIGLPLDLLGFDGTRTGNGIELNWRTANEDNVSHFLIEKSLNGRDFSSWHRVEAIGTGANNYGIKDEAPATGRNFYRLKMVDIDAKYKYSNIVSLNWNVRNSKLVIFPNPASSQVNIEIPQEWRSGAEISLMNMNGQRLIHQKYASVSVINLSLKTVGKGLYMLKVKQVNGDAEYIQKLSVIN